MPCLTGKEVCGEPASVKEKGSYSPCALLRARYGSRWWRRLQTEGEVATGKLFSMLVCKDEYLLQLIATAP